MELIDVSFVHSKGTPFETSVFEGLNFVFESGRFYIVVGPNGSGKTTLLQLIALLLKPTSGRILFDGEDPWKDPRRYRKRMGFTFQLPENQFFCESVECEIAFAPKNFDVEDVENRVRKALKMVDLDESFLERSPFTLSGGEKRKVAIASVIAHDPDFLVLDEPLVNLDWISRWEMIDFLKSWRSSGKGLIISTHHVELFSKISDEIVELTRLSGKDGR